MKWFTTRSIRKPDDQGDASTYFNRGLMHDQGVGVPKNAAEAVKWYRLSAELGHIKAQFNLGASYARGDGVLKDEAESVKWYRMAAEQGDATAQFNLGGMYGKGEGVPKDEIEAARSAAMIRGLAWASAGWCAVWAVAAWVW